MLSTVNRWALAAVVVSLLVRLAALAAGRDAELLLDEKTYKLRAEALLEGRGFVGSYQSWVRHEYAEIVDLPQYPGSWQPPGYTVFLAGILAVTGSSLVAVKLVQVVLGSLSVGLLYLLGRDWFGENAGLGAAWLAALYPNLIAFTHYLFSETLFIFLLLASLVVLARSSGPPRVAASIGAGLLLGAAALTRAALVYFLPVLSAWILWRYRDRLRPAVLAAVLVPLAACATILPWTVRSSLLHDGFVLIETNGPYNLWRGNGSGAFANRCGPDHYPWPFECVPLSPVRNRDAWTMIEGAKRALGNPSPTDLEICRYATAETWREIKGDPWTFVRRIVPRSIDMWNPTSFLVRHVYVGAYGAMPPALAWVIMATAVLAYSGVVILAAVGAWIARRNPHVGLILLLVLFYTVISAISFGLTRFRLPLEPLLLLLAGIGVQAWVRWSAVETRP